jgi:hypothetical protein
VPFQCQLKNFNNDTDKLLELLKQLFHGKARSLRKEKYFIINELISILSVDEIFIRTSIPTKEILKLIYEYNVYKDYRQYAMSINKSSTTESVVQYLTKNKIFKKETETYLLNKSVRLFTERSLTKNSWEKLKFIIGNISLKFNLLSSEKQIIFINEVIRGDMNILTNYFSNLCNELLNESSTNDDDIDECPPFNKVHQIVKIRIYTFILTYNLNHKRCGSDTKKNINQAVRLYFTSPNRTINLYRPTIHRTNAILRILAMMSYISALLLVVGD